jgi:hypothetical protein
MSPARPGGGPPAVAILFNGPPRSGKDTVANRLAASLPVPNAVLKFTAPVKDLAHRRLGLHCAIDAYEVQKDTPLPEFRGLTPRETYIRTSEGLKAEKGVTAVADLFVQAMLALPVPLVINPDVGFDYEAEAVADALGPDNVLLVRIHREGRDFSNDCRSWVHVPRIPSVDLVNEEGRQDRTFQNARHAAEATLRRLVPA